MRVFFLAYFFFCCLGPVFAESKLSRGISVHTEEAIELTEVAEKLARLQGKTLILGKGASGKVSIFSEEALPKNLAYQVYVMALGELGYFLSETGSVLKLTKIDQAVSSATPSKNLSTYSHDAEVAFYISHLEKAQAKDIMRYLSSVLGVKNVFELQDDYLVLVGSHAHLKNIIKVIEFLDNQTNESNSLELFPLKYSSAKEILKIIKGLGLFDKDSRFSSSKLLDTKEDNVIFSFGEKSFHKKVRKILDELDRPSAASKGKRYYVRAIEFSDLERVSGILKDMKKKAKQVGTDSDNSLTDFEVTVDKDGSNLLIYATAEDFSKLNEIIRQVDKKRAQVLFEVDILNILDGFQFKFSTSNIASAEFSKDSFSVVQGWQAEKVLPVVTDNRAEGENISDSALGSKLGAVSEDVVLGILTKDKFQVSGMNAMSPGALIQLMKTDKSSQTLSSPFIMSLDGEEASLVVGETVSYKVEEISQGPSNKVGVSSNMVQTRIEKENPEISLTLMPVVDSASSVAVNLDLKVTTVAGITKDNYPLLVTRNVKQKVLLKNEQTIFISGFKTAEEIETNKKIPFLGDIPLLGMLFRSQSKKKQEGRIMIFITPHIIWGEGDAKRLYENKMKERLARFPQFKKKPNNKN